MTQPEQGSRVLPSQLFAARLRECRETVLDERGKRYTDDEVAAHVRRFTRTADHPQGVGTRQYIGRLRKADDHHTRPTPGVCLALADFYGKPPGYFLAESEDTQAAIDAQLQVWEALMEVGASSLLARSFVESGWARSADDEAEDGDSVPSRRRIPVDAAALRDLAATIRAGKATADAASRTAAPQPALEDPDRPSFQITPPFSHDA